MMTIETLAYRAKNRYRSVHSETPVARIDVAIHSKF